jgi:carboxyl-terminal processing protease
MSKIVFKTILSNLNKLQLLSLLFVSLLSISLSAKVDVDEHQKLIAQLNAGEIPQFSPTKTHPKASKQIIREITDLHYRKPLIDDGFSEMVFDAYIERLDNNRSYLTAADISKISKHKQKIDNALRVGDVSLAYEIFNLFLVRWVERYQFALKTLEKPFDYTLDEEYQFDRTEGPWAKDVAELNSIWRKRVKNDALNLKIAGKSDDEIKELLGKRYQASMRRMAQSTSEDVFWYFMNSVAQAVEPHTNYFSPRAAENFEIDMKLSLDGIGAVLQAEDVYTKIIRLVPKGPADKTGEVHVDDKIIAVGQGEEPMVDVIGWRLDDVVDLIRGKSGTKVRLEILPKNAGADATSKLVTITREQVKLEEQAAKAEVIEVERDGQKVKVGVIEIPKFYIDFAAMYRYEKNYRSTTRDVFNLLQDLRQQDVEGIIIDLRYNGGGALLEAMSLTGLFIDTGPVVQERNYRNKVNVLEDPNPGVAYYGPLAVLVNRSSASASEIFAAAIQDYGRGIVVGEQTFGKGTVQSVRPLGESKGDATMGQLKLTVSKFYRVNGESTQHKGVIPDILFPSAFDGDEYGESAQKNALEWDTIKAVNYQKVGDLSKQIPELTKAHQIRIQTDKEFKYLIDDIKEFVENNEQKSVSLNLKTRKEKRDAREQKLLERENKRRKALGKPLLTSIDDLEDDENGPDPRLEESAEILVDFMRLQRGEKLAYIEHNPKHS